MDGNEKLYDFVGRSDAAGLRCPEPSLCVQSDAIDADINVIVERYGITQSMPGAVRLPEFADYEGIFDFQTAMHAVIEGQREFDALPAKLRARFNHDPQEFLEFVSTPGNEDEMRVLGLLPKVEPTIVAPVVSSENSSS